jgi:hypothetical protein
MRDQKNILSNYFTAMSKKRPIKLSHLPSEFIMEPVSKKPRPSAT